MAFQFLNYQERGDFMQAIILAGGLGTRLKSVSRNKPKALVEIVGKPFIDYEIEYLFSRGISALYFAVGYKAKELVEHVQKTYSNVYFSIENEPLGTGGALKLAINSFQAELGEDFFVLNGDTLIDADFMELWQFHKKNDALATVGLIEVKDAGRFGTVELTDKRIQSFDEKKRSGTCLVNSGIYLFNKRVTNYFPEAAKFSLEYDFFPLLIGREFMGIKIKHNFFIDIGTPESYQALIKRVQGKGDWIKKKEK